MLFSISNPFTEDLAIDLGTIHTFIYARGRGMVVNEPSLVALDRSTGEVVASGAEALEMLGRPPEDIEVVSPLREGAIANSELAQKMLVKFVRKARGGRARFSRRIIVSVPDGLSTVERSALREVIKSVGARTVYLVDEGMAAAIGAKLPVADMQASMVVDLGGATTAIAVVANAGIVVSENVRIGGINMDLAIADYIRQQRHLLIGERTAERLKIVLGSASRVFEEHKSNVKGMDLSEASPEMIEVTSAEVHHAIEPVVRRIVGEVRNVLEHIPPEVAGDLHDRGMTLTGGVALLAGMDERIAEGTGLPVVVAESPRQSVARSLISLYDQPLLLRRVARNIDA